MSNFFKYLLISYGFSSLNWHNLLKGLDVGFILLICWRISPKIQFEKVSVETPLEKYIIYNPDTGNYVFFRVIRNLSYKSEFGSQLKTVIVKYVATTMNKWAF